MAVFINFPNSISSLNFSSRLRPPPSQLTFPPFSTSPLSQTIKFINHFSPANSTSSLPSVYSNTLLCKAKSDYYNVEVVPDEDEDAESLILRFRREVSRARIIPEIKRRRYRETNQEKRKRKAMDAARKYGGGSRRRLLARRELEEKLKLEKEKEEMEDAVDEDDFAKENWDDSIVDQVPYCRS